MIMIICDIDGCAANFPNEALHVRVDNPMVCQGCCDLDIDFTCKRPAVCEKTGPKIREEINKIFSPDNVLKFIPNEKVREAISSVRWSPGVDGKNNFLIYVSGRPGYLLMPTITWLNKNNFPIGMIALLGDLPGDPADNKINFLSKFLNGLNNEIDFVLVFEDDYRTMKKYEEKFSAINGLAMIDNINPDKLLDMKKGKG